nr:hypothetical protein [Tanacetum cinerariifolium]
PDKDVEEPQKKRVAKETLLQKSFKKLKAVKVSGSESTQEIQTNDPKEISKEDVQNMLEIILVFDFKVKALEVRHEMFTLTEKDNPLSNGVMTLMLSVKLQVEEDNEMARVPTFLKELICKVLGLLVLLLELNRFGILLDESEEGGVTSSSQGKVSNITIVLSWGSSISVDGFLPSILLLVNCALLPDSLTSELCSRTILLYQELLKFRPGDLVRFFILIGWANEFHQDKASSTRLTTLFIPLKLKAFAMLAACAFRAVATLSVASFLMVAWVMLELQMLMFS